MNGWQRRQLPDPPQKQALPPAMLERLMAEHLKELNRQQDEIAERIRASRATTGK